MFSEGQIRNNMRLLCWYSIQQALSFSALLLMRKCYPVLMKLNTALTSPHNLRPKFFHQLFMMSVIELLTYSNMAFLQGEEEPTIQYLQMLHCQKKK